MSKMIAWDVFISREYEGALHIDTVYFSKGCAADYVRRSLIEHDGYDPRIVVVRRNR